MLAYEPYVQFVEELGVPQANQRLVDVLSRALNPRIIAVDVTEDVVRYRSPLSYPLGYPSGTTTVEKRIVFPHVSHIDLFDNHVVFVRGADESMLGQLAFANAQDA